MHPSQSLTGRASRTTRRGRFASTNSDAALGRRGHHAVCGRTDDRIQSARLPTKEQSCLLRSTGITWHAVLQRSEFELPIDAGHAQFSTTERYLHLASAQRRVPARCSPLSQRHSAQPVPIGQSIGSSQAPLFQRESEVRTGFEPAYNGFANRCLTTWLPHLAWKRADLATSQGQDQWSRAGFAFLWRRNWPAGFC